MRILIIQTAFIGDAVLATSFVAQTRKLFPQAQIDFLLRKGNEDLLKYHPDISHLWVWDKKRKYQSFYQILKELRKIEYDYLFNLQRFFTMGLMSFLLKAKVKVGFKQNPFSFCYTHQVYHRIPHIDEKGRALHEVERNFQLLQCVKYVDMPSLNELLPQVFSSQESLEKIKRYGENFIILVPSSVWATKKWPLEKWEALVSQLSLNLAQKIYLLGGPADKEEAQRLKKNYSNVENLCGKLSLSESAQLMKSAKCVIAHDSAALHLASCANIPTIAIFCATVREFGFYPLADYSKVLEIQESLGCRPCGLHGKKQCPLKHYKCGHLIDVNRVVHEIEALP